MVVVFLLFLVCVSRSYICASSESIPSSWYAGGEFALAGFISRSINGSTLFDAIADYQVRSWSLMENQTNSNGGIWINKISYRLKIHVFNVGSGIAPENIITMKTKVEEIIIHQKYGYFPVIIAPFPPEYNAVIAGICDNAHRVLITLDLSESLYVCPDPPNPLLAIDCITRAKKPGERRYDYIFSTLFATSKYWNGALYTLKIAGAQTVALITTSDLQAKSATRGIQEALSQVGMNMVYHYSVSMNESLSDSMVSNRIIESIQSSYPHVDILIIHNDDGSSNTVINSMLQYNFIPKAALFAVPPGNDYSIQKLQGGDDTAKYFVSVLQFDPRLQTTVSPITFPHDIYVSSMNPQTGQLNSDAAYQAYLYLSQHLNGYSSIFDPLLAAQGLIILRALDHIHSINYSTVIEAWNHVNMSNISYTFTPIPSSNPAFLQAQSISDNFCDLLRTILQNMYEDSFYGRLQFDSFGRYATDAIVLQATTAGIYELVYPLNSATAKFIYPIPTWDERIYNPSYGTRAIEKLVLALTSCALCIIIILAIMVYHTRHTKVMKAASPAFILCMLFGCSLMISSIYTWTLYETNGSCTAHVWLMSIGYVLMFGALFAKTWRLYCIFYSNDLTNLLYEQLTDYNLAIRGPIPMLLMEIIFLIIWNSVAPFTSHTIIVDPIRPALNYQACYYNDTSRGFFYTSIAYKVIILLIGCILIFKVRNLPDSYNETSYVAACIYQVLFTATILIPIVSTDSLDRDKTFMVRSYGIIGSTLLAATTLCIPKICKLLTRPDVRIQTQRQQQQQQQRISSNPPKRSDPKSRLSTSESVVNNNNNLDNGCSNSMNLLDLKSNRSSSFITIPPLELSPCPVPCLKSCLTCTPLEWKQLGQLTKRCHQATMMDYHDQDNNKKMIQRLLTPFQQLYQNIYKLQTQQHIHSTATTAPASEETHTRNLSQTSIWPITVSLRGLDGLDCGTSFGSVGLVSDAPPLPPPPLAASGSVASSPDHDQLQGPVRTVHDNHHCHSATDSPLSIGFNIIMDPDIQ